MSTNRAKKLAEIVKEEISDILATKMKDPRLGFTTVTAVEVTRDLRYCKIYVSVMGSEDEIKQSLAALDNASGFIRSELGSRIRVRHVPELRFLRDQALEHSMHINKLLEKLNRSEGEDNE